MILCLRMADLCLLVCVHVVTVCVFVCVPLSMPEVCVPKCSARGVSAESLWLHQRSVCPSVWGCIPERVGQ